MSITIASVDPVLTNLSVMYRQSEFIADIVAPRVRVGDRSGTYSVFDKSAFLLESSAARKGMTTAPEVDYSVSTATYSCKEYARRIPVPQEDIDEAKKLQLDPVADAAEIVGEKMKRLREQRVSTLFLTGTQYQTCATYNADSNATYVYMDDYTNSNPFVIIGKCKKQFQLNCGVFPTHIIMNPDIEEIIANHPKRDTKSSQSQDRVSNNELPETFMGMKKVIGLATYNNAKKGRTENMDYLWGNNIFLVYVDPSPGKRKASASYTFDFANGLQTKQYEEGPHKKGTYVESSETVDEVLVCDPCIYIVKSVLANPIGT